MNILLTGGTGLIGRALMAHAPEHQYTVLTRGASPQFIAQHPDASLIHSLPELSSLDAFDAVINLAGEPIADKRWSAHYKAQLRQSRWDITQQLANLFRISNQAPAVFLSASAIGVYGNRPAETLTEHSPIHNSDFPSSLCSQWESIARQASDLTRVVLLRTGVVLTPSGGALKKMLLPFKFCLGGAIGNGRQVMSWIHITDQVRAICFALNNTSISGPVNLVSPTPASNHTFTHTLASTLNRVAILPLPEFALNLLMGESACLLLDSQKVMPNVLTSHGFEFAYPELDSALSALLAPQTDTA